MAQQLLLHTVAVAVGLRLLQHRVGAEALDLQVRAVTPRALLLELPGQTTVSLAAVLEVLVTQTFPFRAAVLVARAARQPQMRYLVGLLFLALLAEVGVRGMLERPHIRVARVVHPVTLQAAQVVLAAVL
jgi:hypothetical protein